jgi:hypothetical protein
MRLPDDTVRCDVGDHLLQSNGDGWQVARVDDVVALTRLVVLKRGDEPVDVVFESPDSVDPAYPGPHLLITTYAQRFADAESAAAAIRDGLLGNGVADVCRPLTAFPTATTTVVARRPPA